MEITLSWILGKRLWDGSEQNLAQSFGIRALEINDSATKTDLIVILETRPISIKNTVTKPNNNNNNSNYKPSPKLFYRKTKRMGYYDVPMSCMCVVNYKCPKVYKRIWCQRYRKCC